MRRLPRHPQLKHNSILLFSMFVFISFVYPVNTAATLTSRDFVLLSKSTGLGNPTLESGPTALNVADMNNDGNLDIISVGDHGNPYVNTQEHGIMVWLG
ncbi:MAG TPA: hypothetical protein VMT57_01875, partial [Candidatus Thermoplasmatota archaeon]|nr:hypothetical protein [Candidatus Thermoplasmatota archaeon]